jgi:hypothetical protein
MQRGSCSRAEERISDAKGGSISRSARENAGETVISTAPFVRLFCYDGPSLRHPAHGLLGTQIARHTGALLEPQMVILAGLKEVSGYSLQRRVYGLKPSLPGTQAGDVMEGRGRLGVVLN